MKTKILKILFADAKLTKERVVCLVSALFWTWLEFMFLKFFFAFAFGMYYANYGMYPEALVMVTQSRIFTTILTWLVVLFIFFTRIPLYKKKTINVNVNKEIIEELGIKPQYKPQYKPLPVKPIQTQPLPQQQLQPQPQPQMSLHNQQPEPINEAFVGVNKPEELGEI